MTPLAADYEEGGWFDKDEQGWCANRVRVWEEGGAVFIREWHDANGIIRTDATHRTTVVSRDDKVVRVKLGGGAVWELDAATGVVLKRG